MEHSIPLVPPLISSIRVGNFFKAYRLEGNEGIDGIRSSAFKFVVDGGAAAIAATSEIQLDDFDKKLRSIIMGKSANIRNLGRTGEVPLTFSVRYKIVDPAYSGILVRYRQPLAYPIPVWKQGSEYPLGFYKLSRSRVVVPQSVVFFASFMNRLQQLAVQFEYLEHRRKQAIHEHTSRISEPSIEQKNVKIDIVCTLGFGSLYMAAAISEGGGQVLGFDASTWIKVFDRCTSRGSKIFGYGGGMLESKKFLKENAELFDQLIDEADVLLRQRDELLAQRSKERRSEKREPFSPTARNL
ncbi:hypothetical protein JCM5350_002954 [Sporobolomyces pararoseus]